MKHSPFIVGDFNIKSIKEDDPDNFIVEGFGSVYGNVDLVRDIVMPGAFGMDLMENGKERPILWQHRSDEPIGLGSFSEVPEGLKVSMKLPKGDDFVNKRVMPQIRVGAVKGLSIGYHVLEETFDRESNVNRLNKLKLRELSIVSFPCNELAQITAAKEYIKANDHSEVKEFKMYPLADEKTDWNEKEAIESIKANTGCESEASRNYGKGFLDFVDNSKSFDDYKMPYVKYIDNEFRIVPNAIYQIAGSLHGKSGNEDIKEFINSVYVKMGKREPFEKGNRFFVDKATLKNMRKSDLKSVFDNENVILSSGSKEMIIEALRCPAPDGSIPGGDKSSILDALKKANEDMETI